MFYSYILARMGFCMKAKIEKKERSESIKLIFKYFKALLASLIITFSSIILFALIIKWASLSDNVIVPVNLVIKAVSVFVGALILTKAQTKGLLNGLIYGIVYTLISFTIFSALAGTFVIGLAILSDFAFNGVVGGIAGILGVNIKKKN